MASFSFCRENILAKYAPLLDAQIGEDDPRYDDYMTIMETEFRAEAYAKEEARNAKLGRVSEHIEYVAATSEEVAAVEYPLGRMAIGPALNEPGFDVVAPAVVAAAIDLWGCELGDLNMNVVIARTDYILSSGGTTFVPQVSWRPLFKPFEPDADHKLEVATANWLRGFIAGHFGAMAP